MNPEYQKIGIVSFAKRMRNKIGQDLMTEDIGRIAESVKTLLDSGEDYKNEIDKIRGEKRYHFGCAAQVGAKDIIFRLRSKR